MKGPLPPANSETLLSNHERTADVTIIIAEHCCCLMVILLLLLVEDDVMCRFVILALKLVQHTIYEQLPETDKLMR